MEPTVPTLCIYDEWKEVPCYTDEQEDPLETFALQNRVPNERVCQEQTLQSTLGVFYASAATPATPAAP